MLSLRRVGRDTGTAASREAAAWTRASLARRYHARQHLGVPGDFFHARQETVTVNRCHTDCRRISPTPARVVSSWLATASRRSIHLCRAGSRGRDAAPGACARRTRANNDCFQLFQSFGLCHERPRPSARTSNPGGLVAGDALRELVDDLRIGNVFLLRGDRQRLGDCAPATRPGARRNATSLVRDRTLRHRPSPARNDHLPPP